MDVLVPIYEKQTGEKPSVVACHAGLECWIRTNYPDMDMISLAQRSVVPIHLMKELVSPHRKILEIFAEILEYSSEIVSSCQSYFQVVTETCEL
jgi:di/tripeptidase